MFIQFQISIMFGNNHSEVTVMELFDSRAKIPHDLQEKYINHTVRSNSDRIISQIRTLPLHSKLVFCACTRLLGQDKKNFKER